MNKTVSDKKEGRSYFSCLHLIYRIGSCLPLGIIRRCFYFFRILIWSIITPSSKAVIFRLCFFDELILCEVVRFA